jgi:hypothetical protein
MSSFISRRKLLKFSAALPVCALNASPGSLSALAGSSSQVSPEVEKSFPRILQLDGLWEFTYDPDPPKRDSSGQRIPGLPDDNSFVAKMLVPGYWDDHADLLQTAPFWSFARFNPHHRKLEFPIGEDPADATLPYLAGVGWYRKVFDAPPGWKESLVTLRVGGARVEAWVWLNGSLLTHHLGHSVPFEVGLNESLRPGGSNTLLIALDNTSEGQEGTSLRGYQGRSAGLYRPVSIKITGGTRIKTCYLRPAKEGQRILWTVDLEAKDIGRNTLLRWKIETQGGRLLGQSTERAQGTTVQWETETFGMRPWTEHTPVLYDVEVSIAKEGKPLDSHRQKFGLRLLERDGNQLRLNGRPIMFRGTTDHYYFPTTTMAPLNVEPYRDRIHRLKELGFNWIRFHTWVPSEEYMQAADELGMMMQVEAPVGFGEEEWIEIVRTCRTHPSVVLYCPGNEEYLDEEKIAFLRQRAADVHHEAPDAFFNPQSALRGVEYKWGRDKDGLGPGAVEEPFPHNAGRLDLLREFTDVFGAYALGMLSYTSLKGEWRQLNERMRIYQRPILSHELGIHGNYLNLDLEHRFERTRIGPDLFAATRRNLVNAGLLPKAELYYRNSCAWMRTLRKETLETARKVKYVAGYDFLAAFDQNWHRSGYPCGIMNDFLELKPGECATDVLKYNGESVLLLDCSHQRTFVAGDRLRFDVLTSLYGGSSLTEGTLSWHLADQTGGILRRGGWPVRKVRNGVIEKLGMLECVLPELQEPTKATVFVELSGGEYEVINNWDFWVFPKSGPSQTGADADADILSRLGSRYRDLHPINSSQPALRIVSALDENTLDFLDGGGRVLLLGYGPFPMLPTSFQMSVTGRVRGNLATVIQDHPLMRRFPHDGYCDWQFHSMLEGGSAVNFNELAAPFDPIIEVVSSFKLVIKQATLFEWGVGEGRLLVSTMNVDLSVPANAYLLDVMIEYTRSKDFKPRNAIDSRNIVELIRAKPERQR